MEIKEGDIMKNENKVSEREDFIYSLYFLQDMVEETYQDAIEAYEVLKNYEDTTRHSLSLSYLMMANQSYIQSRKLCHEKKLEHYNIDGFLEAFRHYKNELKSVITKKDNNLSWLYSSESQLKENYIIASDFIKNQIKVQMER